MATDQRATMGNLIANSNVPKVYPISDHIGMTISGLVGDAQLMIRFMKSEIAVYEMEKGAQMSVQTAATMLGSVIRQGFYLAPLIAGVDSTGGHVFSVDGAGGVLEDEYSSSGSGSIVAYGVLETLYRPNLTKDKAIDVAISGINAARRRDNYSGDGILVIYFGPDGYEWIDNEEIRSRMKALGFNYPQ
jgi:proteasome beta subunit